MQMILLSILCYTLAVGSGYLTYYFYASGDISNNGVYSLIFLIVSVLFLIGGMIFTFLYISRKNLKRLADFEEKNKTWNQTSVHLAGVSDEVMKNIPVGILVYDERYDIMWENSFIDDKFLADKADKSLLSVSRDIVKAIEKQKNEPVQPANTDKSKEDKTPHFENGKMLLQYHDSKSEEKKDKFYEIIHNQGNSTLYFFDVSERENVKILYNNKMRAIGILGIDNLEGALGRNDIQEIASLRAQILGEISDWIKNYHCYIQTMPNDRMSITMDQETLLQMDKDGFDHILDKIAEIAQKSRIRASISMGFACYDVSSEELGALAQAAFDLAEKRGGAQVVLNIHDQNIKYCGGKTNSIAKDNLVEARKQTGALHDAVNASENVICICHNRADCDAIGSMIGAYKLVKAAGKPVKMAFEKKYADVTVSKIFDSLLASPEEKSLIDDIVTEQEAISLITDNTLLLVTDTQSPSLLMFAEVIRDEKGHIVKINHSLLDKVKKLSVVDHHRASDTGWETDVLKAKMLSYYTETSASSAVELISDMFDFWGSNVEFTNMEASIMLAGIIVDTNNFTYRAAEHTFEAASTLKHYNADMVFVRKLLREPMRIEREIAGSVNSTEIIGDHFAVVAIPEDQELTDQTSLAKIADRLLTIEGVDCSFAIGKFMSRGALTTGISARSLGDGTADGGVNVQLVMEAFGGGGHFNAAAAQCPTKTVEEVKTELENLLKMQYIDDGQGKVKVILTEPIDNHQAGDEIEVKHLYADHLIAAKKAKPATDEARAEFAKKQEEKKAKEDAVANANMGFKRQIDGKLIVIQQKKNADGKAVRITQRIVRDEFNAQTGIFMDARKIDLPSEINSLGTFDVLVHLSDDITATFQVKVTE